MNIDLEDEIQDEVIIGKKKMVEETPIKKSVKKNNPKPKMDGYLYALKLWNKKNRNYHFNEIIGILSEYVEEHPDHIPATKLLAVTFVHTGILKDAARYFQRVLSINRNDVESLNALAYLELSAGKEEAAVNFLLDALYIEPDNSRLQVNLDKIKNIKDLKMFLSMTRATDFIFLRFPEQSALEKVSAGVEEFFSIPIIKPALLITLGVVLILLVVFNLDSIKVWVDDFNYNRNMRGVTVVRVSIKDIDRLVKERQEYRLTLSPEDVARKFGMIQAYMESRKFNRARILVNELLNSDADELIKERVLIFQDVMPDVDMDNIDYIPAVEDVIKLPFLYKGVIVRWSGTVANLSRVGQEETAFDLLINFINEAVVDGIAQVHYVGNQNINNNEKIAVYGEIAGITMENKVILKGKRYVRLGREN